MQIENCYDKPRRGAFMEYYFRKVTYILVLTAIAICIVVNLAVGGKPWAGIVAISSALFFVAFVDRPLLENTFLNRLQRIFIWVCILLVYISLFYATITWRAVAIVLTSGVIFINLLLLCYAPRRTKNTLRLTYIIFFIAAEIASLVIGIIFRFWVAFLLCGIAALFCGFVFAIYRKEIKIELCLRIFGRNNTSVVSAKVPDKDGRN